MIGILLNDNSYEQDIRELLMAFYPGETFAHEKQDDVAFYIEGIYSDETFTLKMIDNGAVQAETTFPLDYKNRLAAKTTIKKELYNLCSGRTGKVLPWGTLTGIRPTKIALTRLDEGWKEEDIKDFMRETYLTSEEKINMSVEIATREKSCCLTWIMRMDTAFTWAFRSVRPLVHIAPSHPIRSDSGKEKYIYI